jgi:hypothetical protein
MPLVQAAPNRREWLKTVAIMGVCIILVTILFGAILGAPASLLAGTVGSRRTSSQIVQAALIATGILMMLVSLGELGLIRRFLPGPRSALASTEGRTETSVQGLYRQAAVLGLSMAATFGIICPKPLYLALLVYVALVGNMLYGALALGAYGLGLVVGRADRSYPAPSRPRGAPEWLAGRAPREVSSGPGLRVRGPRGDVRCVLGALYDPTELSAAHVQGKGCRSTQRPADAPRPALQEVRRRLRARGQWCPAH